MAAYRCRTGDEETVKNTRSPMPRTFAGPPPDAVREPERFPLAVALLAAAVAGCLLTLMIGSTRILQLRRVVRRRRRDDRIAAARTAPPQTAGIEPGVPQPQSPSREQTEGASSNGRVNP